jgi:hypothetical protein
VPTEDRFTPDHPLPLFLSGHAYEHGERGSLLLLNASILVLVASLVGMAVLLSFGNPAKVFADIKASLTDISALQPDTVQPTPTIQSTAGAEVLPATAKGAPTRDEIAAASEPADQKQTEISQPPAEALLNQFQAWAADEDARVLVVPVQPVQDAQAHVVQDAPTQVVQEDAPARVRPIQDHRHVRSVQNARAEIRPERHPRAKVRREQSTRVQVAPAQDARAQDPAGQNGAIRPVGSNAVQSPPWHWFAQPRLEQTCPRMILEQICIRH